MTTIFDLFFSIFQFVISMFMQEQTMMAIMVITICLTMIEIILHVFYSAIELATNGGK